ncbi:MAG: hypothetical protein IJA78_05585 [Clostridia bacterium]|nr:hypothetical protein [Clostridia bacterium]
MICRICGTQFNDRFCPRCGAEQGAAPTPPPQEPSPSEAASASEGKGRAQKKQREPKPPIRMRTVFWSGVAMLLPLLYLFVDLFVSLSGALTQITPSGQSNLSVLFARLTSPSYATNTCAELVEGTLGTADPLLTTVSLKTVFTGGADALFVAPVFLVAVFALLCAVMGVLVLFTAGRILRNKWLTDLAVIGGVGATAAPLAGMLLMRVVYCLQNGGFGKEALAAADARFVTLGLSVESMLLLAVLTLVLLPAVGVLRRVGARAQGSRVHVMLPYRLFAERSFGLTRLLAILSVVLALGVLVGYMSLPVLTVGAVFDFPSAYQNLFPNFIAAAKSMWALIAGSAVSEELPTLLAPLLGFAFLLQAILLLVALWRVLGLLYRLCRVRVFALSDRKSDCRSLTTAGKRVRRMILVPFCCFVWVQAVLTVLILLASGVAAHLDFANVSETLGVLYLSVAFVRALGGVTVVYTLLAAVGALLWHTAENLSLALICIADRHKEQQ